MPVAKGRKRSLASATSNASSKRRKSSAKDSAIAFTRDRSPSKNVHFPSNLISGPYVSDPYRRSQSPVRSSLREKEDAHDTPDSQLELELEQRQAQCELSPVRKTAKLKGKSPAKPERGRSNRKADDAMLLDQLSDDEPSSPYYNAENGGFVYDRAKRKQEVADTEDESIHVTQTISLTPSNMDHEYVCTQMDELRAKVKAFAETFPANRTSDALYSLLKWDHKQLVRYIGCLALGGKEGIEGWRSLLSDKTCRHALVCGIVGRCLKEHVFDELCFGADQKLTDILSKKEHEQAGNDGFFRTTQRADTIAKYEKRYLTEFALQKATASVALQLEHLLLPLWQQGSTSAKWKTSKKRDELAAIVEIAGQLSQTMRKDRDTVYYWPPTFKDEEFEPERMEGLDLAGMIRNSPYETKKTKKGHDRAVIIEGHEHRDTALVRIVCFPGVMTFQQGGGELAKHELAKENGELGRAPPDVQRQRKLIARSSRQGELTGEEGFRTRVLCKAVVLLQWGKQRLLTKEAGTSKHFEAKKAGSYRYAKDYEGFVELYDLFLAEMERGEDEQSQSWLPNVSRLFSRSPSLAPVED